jgi:signal transduction histidine kinase
MARSHLPARLRCQGRGLTVALIASALISAIVAMLWQLAVPAATAPAAGYAWLAMLAFGAACAGAGLVWGHQRTAGRLREARQRQQASSQLIDAWLWETDTHHRLRLWRPPPGATAADWSDARPLGKPLWDEFALGDIQGHALKARLEAQAPLETLRVQRHSDAQAWQLRAYPQFDGEGRFNGYVGTAAPQADGEQGRFAQALLDKVWPELDLPALALREHGGSGDRWQVAAVSPDAARLLKVDTPADGVPLAWADACERLPAPLAQAAAALQPGQACEAGEWTLSLVAVGNHHTAGGGDSGRLLLMRPKDRVEPVDRAAVEEQASFAYSVSHDLRAPIRVVEGFARILKEDYGRFLDRIGNDHLERVLAAAARMNSMIDALLALSRLQQQPLSRKPVDLSQLATFILEDLQREHPDRAAELQIEPGMLVHGDPTLLRIALENLLGNAWKYSGQCPITKIEFRHETHQGQRVLMVADNGAGFDMRFADRLFGVFQRLHSANDFQGTGVGLASVRRIIRRHGGDIWAEAEVGKGARFYFTLA